MKPKRVNSVRRERTSYRQRRKAALKNVPESKRLVADPLDTPIVSIATLTGDNDNDFWFGEDDADDD